MAFRLRNSKGEVIAEWDRRPTDEEIAQARSTFEKLPPFGQGRGVLAPPPEGAELPTPGLAPSGSGDLPKPKPSYVPSWGAPALTEPGGEPTLPAEQLINVAGRGARLIGGIVPAAFRGIASTVQKHGVAGLSPSPFAPGPPGGVLREAGGSIGADWQSLVEADKPPVQFPGTVEQTQGLAAPTIQKHAEAVGEIAGLAGQQFAEATGLDPRVASDLTYALASGSVEMVEELALTLLAGMSEDPTTAIGFVKSAPRLLTNLDRGLAATGAVGLSAGSMEALAQAQRAAAEGDWRTAAKMTAQGLTLAALGYRAGKGAMDGTPSASRALAPPPDLPGLDVGPTRPPALAADPTRPPALDLTPEDAARIATEEQAAGARSAQELRQKELEFQQSKIATPEGLEVPDTGVRPRPADVRGAFAIGEDEPALTLALLEAEAPEVAARVKKSRVMPPPEPPRAVERPADAVWLGEAAALPERPAEPTVPEAPRAPEPPSKTSDLTPSDKAEGEKYLARYEQDTAGKTPIRVVEDAKTGAVIEVHGDVEGGNYTLVHRVGGRVDAGARVDGGTLTTWAGGKDMGRSPEGSGAVRRAADQLGAKPSEFKTPAGERAAERFAGKPPVAPAEPARTIAPPPDEAPRVPEAPPEAVPAAPARDERLYRAAVEGARLAEAGPDAIFEKFDKLTTTDRVTITEGDRAGIPWTPDHDAASRVAAFMDALGYRRGMGGDKYQRLIYSGGLVGLRRARDGFDPIVWEQVKTAHDRALKRESIAGREAAKRTFRVGKYKEGQKSGLRIKSVAPDGYHVDLVTKEGVRWLKDGSDPSVLWTIDDISGGPNYRGLNEVTREKALEMGRAIQDALERAMKHDPESGLGRLGTVGTLAVGTILGAFAAPHVAPLVMAHPGAAVAAALLGGLGFAYTWRRGKLGNVLDANTRAHAAGRAGVALLNGIHSYGRMAGASSSYALMAAATGIAQYTKLVSPETSKRYGLKAAEGFRQMNPFKGYKETKLGVLAAAHRNPVLWDSISKMVPWNVKNLEQMLQSGLANDDALMSLMGAIGVPKDQLNTFMHFTQASQSLDPKAVERLSAFGKKFGARATAVFNGMLVFNAAVDRTTRMAYMHMSLAPLMKKYGVKSFGDLLDTFYPEKTDPLTGAVTREPLFSPESPEMKELEYELQTSISGAFNFSGALRPPTDGTWNVIGHAVRLLNRMPLPVAAILSPTLAMFPNYVLANVPEVAMQHLPGAHLIAPRARQSREAIVAQERAYVGKQRISAAEKDVKDAFSDYRRLSKDLTQMKSVAKMQPNQAWFGPAIAAAQQAADDAKNAWEAAKTDLADIRKEAKPALDRWSELKQNRFYSADQRYVEFLGTGITIMGMAMAARLQRGDDGTKTSEFMTVEDDGKKKGVDLTRILGPLTVPWVLGDLAARTYLHEQDPEKYGSVKGFLEIGEEWRELLKAFGYRQDAAGSPGVSAFLGSTPDEFARGAAGLAAELSRNYAKTGAWLYDMAKVGETAAGAAGLIEQPTAQIDPTTLPEAIPPVKQGEWGEFGLLAADATGRAMMNALTPDYLQKPLSIPEAWDKVLMHKRPVERSPLSLFFTVREQSALSRFLNSHPGADAREFMPKRSGVQWYDDIVNQTVAERLKEFMPTLDDTSIPVGQRYQMLIDRGKDALAAGHTAAKRYALENELMLPGAQGRAEAGRLKEFREDDDYYWDKYFRQKLGFADEELGLNKFERMELEEQQEELIEKRLKPPPESHVIY
jgi:hypothetical protein